jgi:hypothetical protein
MTELHQLKFIFSKVFNTIVDNFVESTGFFPLTPKLFNTMMRFAQFLCKNLFQEAVRRNYLSASPAEKIFLEQSGLELEQNAGFIRPGALGSGSQM